MKVCARDVHKERTSRILSRRAKVKKKDSWSSSTQMYVAQCHPPLLVGMYTMCHLLMIILTRLGLLYVDDLFLIGEEKIITECKKKLVVEFEMKDLGLMHYFIGLEV